MFDIGFLELMILGIVGLLVLGPERLPKAARTAGLWIGKIKRSVSGMQREISAQLEAEELRQKLKEQQTKLDESLGKAKRDVESIADDKPALRPRDATARASEQATDTPADEEPPAPKPAAARLDDALASVKEDASPSADGPPDAETRSADDKKDAASR